MRKRILTLVPLSALLVLIALSCAQQTTEKSESAEPTAAEMIERGRYLVATGDCGICHTPKTFTDKGPVEDSTLLFSGAHADTEIPPIPEGLVGPTAWGGLFTNHFTAWAGPWGVSFAANLTPDNVTGIGAWTEEVFIKAMRTGKHMGEGRPVLPPMPWPAVAQRTDDELKAMFAYFQSIKPIANQVPQPIPPPGQ